MINSENSGENLEGGRSIGKPARRSAAASRPRVPGVAAPVASGVKRAGGGVRRSSAEAVDRGRTKGKPAADRARRTVTESVEQGRSTSGRAASEARQAATTTVTRTRSATGHVPDATKGLVDSGRAATGGVVEQAEAAGTAGRALAGKAAATTLDATKGVVGVAGSALRVAGGAAFSFLIGRALLLLQLIKWLGRKAVDTLYGLAERLREKAAVSASNRAAPAEAG